MAYSHAVGRTTWAFADLRDLMAKATPPRSGDMLAGIAAGSAEEGLAARCCLADLPLADLQALHPGVTDSVYAVLTPERSVASRTSFGGTAPANVRAAIAAARDEMGRGEKA